MHGEWREDRQVQDDAKPVRTIRSQDKYEFIYFGFGKRWRNHQLNRREMDDYDDVFIRRSFLKWNWMVGHGRDVQAYYGWRLG